MPLRGHEAEVKARERKDPTQLLSCVGRSTGGKVLMDIRFLSPPNKCPPFSDLE